jgi:hypothetical protein
MAVERPVTDAPFEDAISSLRLANQFFRLHADRRGNLLHRDITEIVAWPKWEQNVAVAVVLQLQVFMLTRDDYVALALEKTAHIASADG